MIYLAVASSNPARIARSVDPTAARIRWAYLGRSFGRTREWEKALGARFERVSFSKRLQELAGSWREPFLEWIAQESARSKDDRSWWTSAIAEKNTLSDSLYHGICYLKIATELAAESESLLLVAEHESLLRAIEANCARPVTRPVFVPREETRLAARFVYQWIDYFVQSLIELSAARATQVEDRQSCLSGQEIKPQVIIHTCIDESYFGDDGKPRDRYFGVLPDMLRGMGYDVRTLPWLYAVRRSRRAAMRWMRARRGEYVIAEDDYSFADYVWAARVVIAQLWRGKRLTHFGGLDVRALVRAARIEQCGRAAIARFVRYERLIRRWAARGMRVDVFIDMFENMPTEKPQVMGFRAAMPATLTVGFQHYAALPPLQLFLRTTPSEAAIAPLPDVIVANSPYSARQIELAGFPGERVRVGASLRYPHIANAALPTEQPRGSNVLVVLSLEENASEELLLKLFDAFSDDSAVTLRVKPHPMAPRNYLGGLLERMPRAFTVVRTELAQEFRGASCAVVLASTSAFEIAVAAVPVVVAGRESDFDQNPLALHPEFPRPAVTSIELRDAIMDRLRMTPAEWQRLRDWAARTRAVAFVPATADNVRAFVERAYAPIQSKSPEHVEAL